MNKSTDHAPVRCARIRQISLGGAGLALLLTACSNGPNTPLVLEATRTLSPDSRWEVTVERVEDRSGLGITYHEVHVHEPNAGIALHGNHDASVVFYMKSDHRTHDRPVVEWTEAGKLKIRYPRASAPGKMATAHASVGIEYETFALPLSCTEALL